ncbi:MAG: hypothetical protein WB014_09545 [Methanosarcina sp.]
MTTKEGKNRTPLKGNSFSIDLPYFKKREQETLCYDEFCSVSVDVTFEFAKWCQKSKFVCKLRVR